MTTRVNLYQRDRTPIPISNEAVEGDGTDYKYIWTCPLDDRYYLTVGHRDGGQGTYNLAVRLTQPSDGPGGAPVVDGGSGGGCFVEALGAR
jgi:hypothetical protein